MRLSIGDFVQLFKTDDLLACFRGSAGSSLRCGQLSACAEGAALLVGGLLEGGFLTVGHRLPGEGLRSLRLWGPEHRPASLHTRVELPRGR